ncbi:ABC transporter ATP-binding protein [Jeotgalibacillus marinus]|uniref:ABC transporter ATP-binding protein n=1 Tax=Jeotgalibacillus marinus TaxID=86667 RepID=A0ABV3Q1H1_9BACL
MKKRLDHVVISFDQVTYRHSEELDPVLNELSFVVNQGDSVLLSGPSGAGKSTLTMLMNGILPENGNGVIDGRIKWFGTVSTNWVAGSISKKIGVMFQDPDSQFCQTTVEEEIAFGLENLHLPRTEMVQRIHTSLASVGLDGFEQRTIHQLSGGQKQRVALACLLAMKTEILLLDEPFANIDPLSRRELIACLFELKQTFDLTIIVIDHDLHGWVEWIDRALLLDTDGRIQLDKPMDKALSDHYDVFEELTIALPLFIQVQKIHGQCVYVKEKHWKKHASEQQCDLLHEKIKIKPKKETNTPPLIQAEALTYSVEGKDILQNVDLDILQGETIAFCGHNGAGKSTLALLLAGLFNRYTGKVYLQGKPLEHLSSQEVRSQIGYVFQNPEHQFVEHTVKEDVGFGLKLKRLPEEIVSERIQSQLRSIGLVGYEDHHPLSLSQGQKRRLSVASMTIDDQTLLLLDEPTYGQDAKSLKNLVGMIQERKQQGKTTVMVTHDMELVQEVADRTLLLSDGKKIFQGPTSSLWQLGEETLEQHGLVLPSSVKLRTWLGGLPRVATHH